MASARPTAILIGAQKSGTTSFFRALAQHPEVYGEPAMEDFPFFSADDYYLRGTDWFEGRFPSHRGEAVVLHGHAHYLASAEPAAGRVLDYDPGMKLLAVLRDPAERAWSAYQFARRIGIEANETFEAALLDEQAGRFHHERERAERSYLGNGFYGRQVEAWLSRFPAAQMHVVTLDELQADAAAALRGTFRFLGVDEDFPAKLLRENPYAEPRSRLVQALSRRGVRNASLRELVPFNVRLRLRRLLHSLNARPADRPALDAEVRQRLRASYREDIERLEALLGRDLAAWKR